MNTRIEINPNICHGNPVIKNTRVLVSNILADLAAGNTYPEIIHNYPNITEVSVILARKHHFFYISTVFLVKCAVK